MEEMGAGNLLIVKVYIFLIDVSVFFTLVSML